MKELYCIMITIDPKNIGQCETVYVADETLCDRIGKYLNTLENVHWFVYRKLARIPWG